MVTTTIAVTVARLRIHLLKVVFPGGYHLVCGGRLLMEAKGGNRVKHPELPDYTPEMFPSFAAWSNGNAKGVQVLISTPGGERTIGMVRACALLFTALPRDRITSWIRGGGK